MADVTEIKKLAKMIDMIARCCWRGLPALMGKAPEPTREQLKEALFFKPKTERVSVHGGKKSNEGKEVATADAMIDTYDPILAQVPWTNIVSAVRWFEKNHSREWRIYVELISRTGTGRATWGGVGTAQDIANKYDISVPDVYDIARKTPRLVARAISMGVYQLDADYDNLSI